MGSHRPRRYTHTNAHEHPQLHLEMMTYGYTAVLLFPVPLVLRVCPVHLHCPSFNWYRETHLPRFASTGVMSAGAQHGAHVAMVINRRLATDWLFTLIPFSIFLQGFIFSTLLLLIYTNVRLNWQRTCSD